MTKRLLLIAFILMSVKLLAQSPILSNFRVENAQKNRVYFDSSDPITGSNTTGFKISGKTISGITINSGQTADHYFTVSSAFTFWDNNTIRYESGSDVLGANGDALDKFTLEFIVNNIPEMFSSGTVYYVSLNGQDNNDGLSEGNAFRTISKATKIAGPGSTIWIKAGDYGNEHVSLKEDGAINNPIKIKGYKNSVGDLDGVMYYQYSKGRRLDASEMPLLNGNGGNGITISSDYIILKNIQLINYRYNILIPGSKGVIIDNCIAHVSERTNYKFESVSNSRITRSISVNADTESIKLVADHSLIDNCKVYADTDDGSNRTDYYYTVRGRNNILRNSLANNAEKGTHSGHGLSVKSVGVATEYNLIENCDVYDVNFPIESRHDEVKFNVFRDIRTQGTYSSKSSAGSIFISNGSSFNRFENITVKGGLAGIRFSVSNEDPSATTMSHDNTFVNCIFDNNIYGIYVTEDSGGQNRKAFNNKIINCTFYDNDYMLGILTDDFHSNEIINSTIVNTKRGELSNNPTDLTYSYSNFFNNTNFNTPSGNNNISSDPKFENPSNGNFRLSSDSPLIDKGLILGNVNVDFDGNSRPQGSSIDIGAFEKKNENSNPNTVTASAGPDTTVCSGSSTTLTASGGDEYLWNTGETTASITVSPTVTTIYSVTVSQATESDTDEVEVIVEELPSVSLEDDITICSGESATLTATGTGDFLWNTGETTASITVNPTTTTTYSVTATNSCTTDATDEIIVNVNPAVGLTVGSDVSICVGESTTLIAAGNGDFLWNTGETTASITVQPNSTTTYTVTSNFGDCTENESVLVTVNEPPSVDLGSDQSICYGETATLTATGTGDFLWSTGETTASITVNPITTTTYSVIASNSCATDITDDIIVNVNPDIGLTVGNDISICIGESTTLTATGNGDFLWSTGETTPSITVQPSSTTTYTVSSNLGYCTENANILVTVNEPPTVDLGADLSICYGETVTLTATGTGDFLWSTGETTANIVVSPTSTTTYSVTASNACSDAVTDDIIVNVNPEIGLTVGNDINICAGESTTLTATGNGDFLWSTGETTPSITIQPDTTTTYTVTSSSGGCTENASILVTVSESASVELGENITICYGEDVTLNATGIGDFLWSTGETISSITVTPTTTTTYSVTASNSCLSATDTITVIVNELPSINAGEDVTIFSGESTTLTATGAGSFLWSTGETSPSIEVSPSHTTTYSVVVTTDQGCLNQDTVIVNVLKNESVAANAGPDQYRCPNSSDTVLTAIGGESYLWSTGETTASISVSPTVTTVYTVSVYVGNWHGLDEVTVHVDESCSDDVSVEQEFKVYPNPTNGLVNIEMLGFKGDLNVSLYNLNGSMVHTENMNNNSKEKVLKSQINLSMLAKGMYIVRLNNGNTVVTKKLMVI